MDYKVTFEDGSEALMHHGIKGMKWGVWNAETAARRSARRAEKKEANRYKGPDSKAKRFGKNLLKWQARADVPVSLAYGTFAGTLTGNPMVGLVAGGFHYAAWSTMSHAECGAAVARGRKSYWDKIDETLANAKNSKQ